MLFQLERFWRVSVEDRSSLQRQKIYIVKTYFNGCAPSCKSTRFLPSAFCVQNDCFIQKMCCVIPPSIIFSIFREPYSDNVPLNMPWKCCLKAVIYELCVVETTAHVICRSGQSRWLEENPYDVCRSLWLEIQDVYRWANMTDSLFLPAKKNVASCSFF